MNPTKATLLALKEAVRKKRIFVSDRPEDVPFIPQTISKPFNQALDVVLALIDQEIEKL